MKSCPAPVANPVRVAVPPDHFLAPWFIIEDDKAILSVVPEFLVHSLHGLLDEGYKHSESRWMAFGVRPNCRHGPPFSRPLVASSAWKKPAPNAVDLQIVRHGPDGSIEPLKQASVNAEGRSKWLFSTADHRQHHLKPADCFQGVGLIGRHDDHLPSHKPKRHAGNRDFDFPLQHIDQGVERSGVFAEFLTGIEGEQRDVPALLFEQALD